jgi:hypothetical protein
VGEFLLEVEQCTRDGVTELVAQCHERTEEPRHAPIPNTLREGCTNSVPSGCRLIVFVQQSAESISPTHRCINGKSRPSELVLLRCVKLQCAVRSLSVVMTDVDAEDALEVASGEYEQPVQAFSHGSDPALAHGVGTRGPDGGANHPQVLSYRRSHTRSCTDAIEAFYERPASNVGVQRGRSPRRARDISSPAD